MDIFDQSLGMPIRENIWVCLLQSCFPGTVWRVQKIYEGHNCDVYRAYQLTPDASQSVIIKRIRPHTHMPYHFREQAVQRCVLSLWQMFSSALFPANLSWHCPAWSHWISDRELDRYVPPELVETIETGTSTLITNDLGHLRSISDFFHHFIRIKVPLNVLRPCVASLAQRLGFTLALLHANSDFVADKLNCFKAHWPDIETSKMIYDQFVSPVRHYLQGSHDGERLFARIAEDYRQGGYAANFSLGVLTPDSIGLSVSRASWIPAITDWKFIQLNGRGVNGDIAQFLAGMCAESTTYEAGSVGQTVFVTFIREFSRAYAQGNPIVAARDPECYGARVVRSTALAIGRELIRWAMERCSENEQRDRIVDWGLIYLRMAGDNMQDFVIERNWDYIQKSEGLLERLFVWHNQEASVNNADEVNNTDNFDISF